MLICSFLVVRKAGGDGVSSPVVLKAHISILSHRLSFRHSFWLYRAQVVGKDVSGSPPFWALFADVYKGGSFLGLDVLGGTKAVFLDVTGRESMQGPKEQMGKRRCYISDFSPGEGGGRSACFPTPWPPFLSGPPLAGRESAGPLGRSANRFCLQAEIQQVRASPFPAWQLHWLPS